MGTKSVWLKSIDDDDDVEWFMQFGMVYMNETTCESDDSSSHEPFLRSVLRRRLEPDRWLMRILVGQEAVGFCHAKLESSDAGTSGYILEFYITPAWRLRGVGSEAADLLFKAMADKGAVRMHLFSNPPAEGFWRSCGFDYTGEIDDPGQNQKEMAMLYSAQ